MKFNNILAFTLPVLSSANAGSLKSLLSTHPKLSTLHDLLSQFGLLEDFNSYKNVTLIAPTNQAYLDLANWGFNVSLVPAPVARALLTYHVLQGEHTHASLSSLPNVIHTYLKPPVLTNVSDGAALKLSLDASDTIITQSGLGVYGGVEEADIHFDDGVVHTLNSSLVLPHNITLTAGINGLTRFLELISKADLVEEFEGLKDVTVLIPQNEALENLSWLMKMLPREQLASVLRSHVIPKQVLYGSSFENGKEFKSLQGGKLKVKKGSQGELRVNGVRVVSQDVILYGGVAHVLEGVLALDADEGEEISAKKNKFVNHGYQIPMN